MIAFLKGELMAVKNDSIYINVQGIGYKAAVPSSAVYKLPQPGEEILVQTYLHVREDAVQLYAFLDEEERELFEILLSVSGVGPKVALAILSATTVAGFKQAVLQDKIAMLTQIPGIGAKTAQRMVLELKDKLAKADFGLTDSGEAKAPADAGSGDALNALVALGYNHSEAMRAIKKITASGEVEDVETIIKMALKELAR